MKVMNEIKLNVAVQVVAMLKNKQKHTREEAAVYNAALAVVKSALSR